VKTEGDVLDIHFSNETDVDIYRISLVVKNTSDHCKKKQFRHIQQITCLDMTYDRLYEHHTDDSNGDPPGSTTSATCD
jgi:hypothetical protein